MLGSRMTQGHHSWTQGHSQAKSATKCTTLSLLGKLDFVWCVCRPGWAFLCHLIQTSVKATHLHYRIEPNDEFQHDITWWLQYLPSWNGMSFLYDTQWFTIIDCEFSLIPAIWPTVTTFKVPGAREHFQKWTSRTSS